MLYHLESGGLAELISEEKILQNCTILQGMAAYSCLLLAPEEGWWPLANWRALWALFSFKFLGGPLSIIFI